jgi:2-keto-4-pentenoate hydratase
MQVTFGLDHPDYGFLHANTFHYKGSPIYLNQFIKLYIELEPIFVLKITLKGPNVTIADAISAIDYVVPVIKIIDSRIKK